MFSKNVVVLLLAFAVFSPPVVLGGRWFLTFKTANNWMAGYIGDVMVCFHFRPEISTSPTLTTVDVNEEMDNVNGTIMDEAISDPIDNRTEDCQTLPWRSFERGKNYIFGVDFIKNTELEKVRLFTKLDNVSLCNRKSLDTWHVEDVSFQNMVTGQLFQKFDLETNDATSKDTITSPPSKPLKNPKKTNKKATSSSEFTVTGPNVMLIGPKCEGGEKNELILEDFNVSIQPRPCDFGGVIYKDGEPFEDGCTGICKCQDGGVGCVSRCPPFISPGCRHVHVPNECCEDAICDTKVQQLQCPVYEENDCETANRTVTPGEFPWSAFIKLCDKKNCSRYCSGVLVSDQWILSASECLMWPNSGKQANPEQIRVMVGESTLFLVEDRDIELAVESVTTKPGSGGLALLKLKERVMFDKVVQPALMPHSKDHCQQLLQPDCGITLIGWVNVGPLETDQYELYKLNTQLEDPSMCPSLMAQSTTTVSPTARRRKPPPPSRHRDTTLCIDMGNDEPALSTDCGTCQPESDSAYTCVSDKNTYLCSGEKGRTIVSRVQVPLSSYTGSFKEVDILVGVVTYNQTEYDESDGRFCNNRAHRLGVGICNELNWITNTISQVHSN